MGPGEGQHGANDQDEKVDQGCHPICKELANWRVGSFGDYYEGVRFGDNRGVR